MKKTLTELLTNDKGQALIIVLILLLVGGLLIVPVLNYASTTLKTSQVFEKNVKEIYAADAGIEYGLWQLKKGADTVDKTLTVNGTQVTVKVVKEPAPAEGGSTITAGVTRGGSGEETWVWVNTWEAK